MSKNPRVLFISHSLGDGGSERVTATVANYLAQERWPVAVVPLATTLSDYVLDPTVSLSLDIPNDANVIKRAIRKALYINSQIREFNPDVVVTLGAGHWYILFSRLFNRFRIVSSLRNDPGFLFEGNPIRKFGYMLIFAISQKVIFQSEGAQAYFGSRYAKKARIIHNPLKVDLPYNSMPLSARAKEIVNFGRLKQQKRLDLLIEAFGLFRQVHPEYTLTIFGRGPERDNIMEVIQRERLEEYVSLEDFQPDVHARIKNSSMYVSSSDVEGVSNSMLEAMAIGLPVVCTDCPPGGSREIVEAFSVGTLAQTGNAKDISAKMISIVEDEVSTNKMIARGRDLTEALSPDVICRRWAEAIKAP